MEVSVSLQRPRPFNLSLGTQGDFTQTKSVTPSLKLISTEFTKDQRFATSATFKNNTFISKSALLKVPLQRVKVDDVASACHKQVLDNQVVEVVSDGERSAEAVKNTSTDNSSLENANLSQELIMEKSKSEVDEQEVKEKISTMAQELEAQAQLIDEMKQEAEAHQQTMAKELEDKSKLIAEIKEQAEVKQSRIVSMEAEIQALAQENNQAQKSVQIVHEAKVMINEFNEKLNIEAQGELIPAIKLLMEECIKSQEAAKAESYKIKEVEVEKDRLNHELIQANQTSEIARKEVEILRSQANEASDKVQELDAFRHSFMEKIDSLEKEKAELYKNLSEASDELKRAREHTDIVRIEMSHVISSLEAEKKALVQDLDENLSVLRNVQTEVHLKENEIMEFKATMEKLKQEHETAMQAILMEERESLHKRLEESEGGFRLSVAELEEKLQSKDQYIEALIFDVNQMKEFIVDHHGDSVFEKDGEATENQANVQTQAHAEVQAPVEIEEVAPIKEDEAVKETEKIEKVEKVEDTQDVESTPAKKKVVIYVEDAKYGGHKTYEKYEENYYDSRYTSSTRYDSWRVPFKKEKEESKKPNKRVVEDTYVPKKETKPVKEVKEIKPVKTEAPKPEPVRKSNKDIINEQLEKMIFELNEKLANSEKKARKMVEEKMAEMTRIQDEKEQQWNEQLESMKTEKKDLLKKIDDLQWEQAYLQNGKKPEEIKGIDVVNKNAAATDGKKKKKK